MLVTVNDDSRSEGSAPVQRLVLPEVEQPGQDPSDLRSMVIDDSATPTVLVVSSEVRPLVSEEQFDRVMSFLEAGSVVVATAPVADTMRDQTGNIVDRSSLVEVTAPLAVAADVAARLAQHPEPVPATVAGLLEAAITVGAHVVVTGDDGSGQWAGRPDHLAVARARVGP